MYVNASTTTTYYAQVVIQGSIFDSIFNFTGAEQIFEVPNGVSSLSIVVKGAQGNQNGMGISGGLGGIAEGELNVNSGDLFYVYVGQGGIMSTSGGFNGGGNAGLSPCTQANAGGGGGATDIRFGGNSINDRIIVGAGGGGAGGNRVSGCGRGTGGGGGGGYFGGGGGAAWPSSSVVLPTGGTQTSPGTGGVSEYATLVPTNYGTDAIQNIGGNGGVEISSNQAGSQNASIGSDGGGLIGDNGSYSGNFTVQSGAGGSSYFGSLANGTTTSGNNSGNGSAVISYKVPCFSMSRIPVTVTFNPLPTLNVLSNSSIICEYTPFEFSANGGDSIAWNGPSLIDNNSIITTTLADSGTYTVTAFDLSTSCTTSASIELEILDAPDVVISSNGITFCAGDTLYLDASGSDTYVWSNGVTTSNQSFVVTNSSEISVESTLMSTGCTYSDTLEYTVNALPNVFITSTTNEFCQGDTVSLTANGAQTYLWDNNSTGSTLQLIATLNDTLNLNGTDAFGCVNNASFSITVNALPIVSLNLTTTSVCSNAAAFTLDGGIPLGGTWSGTAVSNELFSPSIGVLGGNPVFYTYIDTNNCSNSANQSIDVIDCAGIEEFENESIQIFPNPFTSSIEISSEMNAINEIIIYNQEGKLVSQQTVSALNCSIDLSPLTKGFYMVSILTDKDRVVKRIEKM